MKDADPINALPAYPRAAFLLLLILFGAGLYAILPSFHAYFFGDEHFYTDSAIRMHQTGQILTPTYADGALRFNKPVLSYWMILAGFRLFGVSVLSSRLASLAAGLLILWLTRKLALRLFKSETAGWVAALVMASNIELMTAAMRATPDIFLCLFSLLSLYGFAGLLLGEPRRSDAWLAYAGAGLAVASKGMLGVVLLVFVVLFAACRRDRAVRLRALARPLPILACLLLALWWFVAVYLKYGDLALNGFLHDQVGNRVASSPGSVLGNLFHYSLGLAEPFLPWSVILLAAAFMARDRLREAVRGHGPALLFCGTWFLLLLVIFSPANLTRTRYMLPAFPFLASAAALFLSPALAHPAVGRLTDWLLRIQVVLLVPASAGFALMGVSLGRPRLYYAAAAFFLLAAVTGVVLAALWRNRGPRPAVARPILLALAAFTILWAFHDLVRPAFPSTPSYALARTLARAGAWHVVYPLQEAGMTEQKNDWYKEKYASQVRLISGGAIQVRRIPLADCLTPANRLPVICVEEDAPRFPPDRFTAVRAGNLYREGLTPRTAWTIARSRDPRAALRAYFVSYYVMFPKEEQKEHEEEEVIP